MSHEASIDGRLPSLSTTVFDDAWRGAEQLARERGESTTALVARAAMGLRRWTGCVVDANALLDADEA